MVPSELSNVSSMLATPTGLRFAEPLKMTSTIESPRSVFADASPSTQRIASMTFDLPQPFGPTTPMRLLGKRIVVVSTKDLKPESLILLRRIGGRLKLRDGRLDGRRDGRCDGGSVK